MVMCSLAIRIEGVKGTSCHPFFAPSLFIKQVYRLARELISITKTLILVLRF